MKNILQIMLESLGGERICFGQTLQFRNILKFRKPEHIRKMALSELDWLQPHTAAAVAAAAAHVVAVAAAPAAANVVAAASVLCC